jgi:hypothetical protein
MAEHCIVRLFADSLRASSKISGMQLQLVAVGIEKVKGIRTLGLLPLHNARGYEPVGQMSEVGRRNCKCRV